MSLDNAVVYIQSVSDGRVFDSNTSGCTQISAQHPRPFLWQHEPQHHHKNHQWKLVPAAHGEYMIVSQFTGLALDGNVAVPQATPSHPQPFMWQPTPSAPNHRWRFIPTGQPGVFGIQNVANGLALDANVAAISHHGHPSPFMWQWTAHAPNHHWRLIFATPVNAPVSIVCASSGLALDANTSASPQISAQHPRPFMWQHTPSAANHRWTLQHIQGDEYMIVSQSNGLALDGNVQVPQQAPSHPKPFLWQPTPSAANHRWRIVPSPVHGNWVIINSANGLALDGNTSATQHMSHQHPSPFLWQPVPTAPNHQWQFRY